eukprot:m.189766 g.189766  ORF g.189766 m.189766 type:complete len:302 (-) comp17820_c0_seq1:221-1126(-)
MSVACDVQERSRAEINKRHTHAVVKLQIAQCVEVVVSAKVTESNCRVVGCQDKPWFSPTVRCVHAVRTVLSTTTVPGGDEERVGTINPPLLVRCQPVAVRDSRRGCDVSVVSLAVVVGLLLWTPPPVAFSNVLRTIAKRLLDVKMKTRVAVFKTDPCSQSVSSPRVQLNAQNANIRTVDRHPTSSGILSVWTTCKRQHSVVRGRDEPGRSRQEGCPRLPVPRVTGARDHKRELLVKGAVLVGHKGANNFAGPGRNLVCNAFTTLDGKLAGMERGRRLCCSRSDGGHGGGRRDGGVVVCVNT